MRRRSDFERRRRERPRRDPVIGRAASEALAQPAVLTGDTANPVTVYIGFKLAAVAKSGYGSIAYYGPASTGLVRVDLRLARIEGTVL
jgi:hypothetical protein